MENPSDLDEVYLNQAVVSTEGQREAGQEVAVPAVMVVVVAAATVMV